LPSIVKTHETFRDSSPDASERDRGTVENVASLETKNLPASDAKNG
jgi:hypothetical protein